METIAPEQAAQLLKALERHTSAGSLFVRAAVDPGDLAGTWKPAMAALRSFQSQYSWRSSQRKKMVAEAAANPRVLAASQAAATQDDVPLELLAVLAFDGSEASADALMPHFHRALKRGRARVRIHLRLDSVDDDPTLWLTPNAVRVASKTMVLNVRLGELPETLAPYAKKLGVVVLEGQTARALPRLARDRGVGRRACSSFPCC